MRILTFFFILFASFVHGQKLKNIEAIKLNTKFTLELHTDSLNNFSYNIVSTEPFEGELKMNSAFKLFDENIKENQIQGILAIGTFGSQRSILLAMKSGLFLRYFQQAR